MAQKKGNKSIPSNPLKRATTKEGNKNQHEWCQDEDHNPFRVHILQLGVLEKVRSVFTRGGWSWIKSRATVVEGACGRANPSNLAAIPAVWAPLTISGHLPYNSSLFPSPSYRKLFNMHRNAHTQKRPSAVRWITEVIFLNSTSSVDKVIHMKYAEERKREWKKERKEERKAMPNTSL